MTLQQIAQRLQMGTVAYPANWLHLLGKQVVDNRPPSRFIGLGGIFVP